MRIYVASKHSLGEFALHPVNVIEVCASGPSPFADAQSYAKDYTLDTDEPAYVYAVDVQFKGRYDIVKEVVYRSTPES